MFRGVTRVPFSTGDYGIKQKTTQPPLARSALEKAHPFAKEPVQGIHFKEKHLCGQCLVCLSEVLYSCVSQKS